MAHFLGAIHWDVGPVIFQVGRFAVRYYGLLFALAFVVGYRIMSRIYKREGLDEKELDRLSIFMILSTVIGARLGHVFFYEPKAYLADPISILKIWEGGLASHGAAIAILIALFIYTRKPFPHSYMWLLDRIVIPIPLGGAFIRLGNLMNSEIYGHQTSLPWGFIFDRDPTSGGVPRHPTQLYEAGAYVLLFILLWRLYKRYGRATPQGLIFGTFLVVLWSARLLIEFVKEPQVASEGGLLEQYGLNIGQLLSIPFIIIGLIILARALRKPGVPEDGTTTPA